MTFVSLVLSLSLLIQVALGGQCDVTVPSLTATQWTVQNVNLPTGHPNLGQVRTVPRAFEVGDYCLSDNPSTYCDPGRSGICTSNDIQLAQATYVSGPRSCEIGKTVTLTFAIQWISTAQTRYDVSAYIAMDGGDALKGSCYGTILYGNQGPAWPSENRCNPDTCIASPAPIGSESSVNNGPYLEDSSPLDSCRDLRQDQPTWQTLSNVPFICRDLNNDGTADISACLGWQQNANEARCNGIDRAIVNSAAKCNCQTTINIQGLTVCSAQQTLCYGSNGALNSAPCEPTFSARFKVTTGTTATYLPASSVLYGNIYLDFQDTNQRMGIQYFDPAGKVTTDDNLIKYVQTSATDQVVREDILWPCKSLQKVNCGSGCTTLFATNWIPRLFREGPYAVDTSISRLSPDTIVNDATVSITGTCPSIRTSAVFGALSPRCARKFNILNSPPTSVDHVWYSTDAAQASRTVIEAALQRDGTVWEFIKTANLNGASCSVATPNYGRGLTLPPAPTTSTRAQPFNLPCTGSVYDWTKFDTTTGCSTTQPVCTADTEVAFVIDAQTSIPLDEWRNNWLPYVWRTTQGFSSTNDQILFGFCFSSGQSSASPYCNPATLNSDDTSICQSYLKVTSGSNPCGSPSSLGKTASTTDFRGMIDLALRTYFPGKNLRPRRLVVLVGGPDAGSSTFTWGQIWNMAAAAGNVQIHAVGIGAGALDTALLQNIVGTTGGTYSQWASSALLTGDSYLYRRLCPSATPVCSCSGFCACANSVGVCPAACNGGSLCNPATCDVNNACSGCVVSPGNSISCSNKCFECNDLDGKCNIAKVCPEPGSNKDTLCTDWSCAVVNGQAVCQGTPKPASHCDDSNGCTVDECVVGVGCRNNDRSSTICNDGNKCTNDACTSVSGKAVCSYTPINVNEVCGDQNACTTDTCVPGTGCQNTPITCNDDNACTTDTCDTKSGCVFTPIVCKDTNACTTDTCNTKTGCVFTPVNVATFCNDNDACTTDTCDPTVGCVFTGITCNDGSKCTTDTCDKVTGCKYTGITCDDGLKCTTDTCDSLQGCVFTLKNCQDADACTSDTCDAGTGNCQNTKIGGCDTCAVTANCAAVRAPNSCEEKLCVTTTGECTSTWVAPFAANLCTTAIANTGAYCGIINVDSKVCPPNKCGSFTCDGSGANPKCTATYVCDDKNACTSDRCEPTTGCVYESNVKCGKTLCYEDTCDTQDGKCKRTSTTVCDDKNVCTNDVCVDATGCKSTDPSALKTACDGTAAADKCNTYTCDPVKGCVSTPITCDDGLKCTTDTCDSTTGCKYTNIVCSDSNDCTDDSCDTATGNCKFTTVNSAKCLGCAFVANPCNGVGDLCNPPTCVNSCTGLTGAQLTECQGATKNSLATQGYYCATKAVQCNAPSTCIKYSCDVATGKCVSDLNLVCNTKGCTPEVCVEGTGCVKQTISNPCTNVELSDKCAPAVCVDDNTFQNGFRCDKGTGTRDCTDYTCIAEKTATQPVYVEYVIGTTSKDQFLANYQARGATCAVLACTIDRCEATEGCVNDLIACQAPLGTCNVTVGCFETGNAFNFPAGICQLQVDQSLVDFCGVCFGDYASCFFQTVVPVSTVAGIAGGVVAGIVIAAIVAALLIFWLTKKGYDYYQVKSQMTATGLQENPTFQASNTSGVVPD